MYLNCSLASIFERKHSLFSMFLKKNKKIRYRINTDAYLHLIALQLEPQLVRVLGHL